MKIRNDFNEAISYRPYHLLLVYTEDGAPFLDINFQPLTTRHPCLTPYYETKHPSPPPLHITRTPSRRQAEVQVTGGIQLPVDEVQIAAWLAKNGPVSIGINAFMMQFYMG